MTGMPLICHIRRGSADDGPGIRTTVFFKGCPLACDWCHNPEAMASGPQLSFAGSRCLGDACAACATTCPGGATSLGGKCSACGNCAECCPTGARRLLGSHWPMDRLLPGLLADRSFYHATGGGVTLSGGEPTMHLEYASLLLRRLKEEGIHTAIHTCGFFDTTLFRHHLLPYLDLIYFDLKLMDASLHRRHTGADNRLILANFAALAGEAGDRLVPRTPLVPAITATDQNLSEIAAFLSRLEICQWELLPYNPGGLEKRRHLSLPLPPQLPETPMGREEELALRDKFRQRMTAATT